MHRVLVSRATGRGYDPEIALAGPWLATAEDGEIRLWDPGTWRPGPILTGHTGRVLQLVPSPSGSWLAGAGRDGTVRIWSLPGGEPRHVLTGHDERLAGVVAFPDGRRLASIGGNDETVRIWDALKGTLLHVLPGHTGWAGDAVVPADGSWIATGAFDRTVRVWTTRDGVLRHELKGHRGVIQGLWAAPDGSWLASAGDDRTIRVWDPCTGACLHVLTGETTWFGFRGAAAPDGTWLTVCDKDSVQSWEPATGRLRWSLPGSQLGLSASADGTVLFTGGRDAVLRAWDAATGEPGEIRRGHGDQVAGIVPGDSWLASRDTDRTVRIWSSAVCSCAFDPPAVSGLRTRGRTVLVGDRLVLRGHEKPVLASALSPDGTWLASASGDGTVRTWDAATGEPRLVLTKAHRGVINDIAIAPDGTWLATAGKDRHTRVWDAASGARRFEFEHRQHRLGDPGAALRLAVSADGAHLATATGSGLVQLWSLTTGLREHDTVLDLAPDRLSCRPDGTGVVIVAGDAETVHCIHIHHLDGAPDVE